MIIEEQPRRPSEVSPEARNTQRPSMLRRFVSDPECVVVAVLTLLIAVVYFQDTVRTVRWNDPAAYYYSGLSIAETGRSSYYDVNNVRVGPYFSLHGFLTRKEGDESRFYPTQPVGLPILIAAVSKFLPASDAVLYLVPILSIAGLVFLFVLGRMLFGRWVGLLAMGLLAFQFDYWSLGTELFTDSLAVALLLAGFVFGILAARRNSALLGLLGGGLLGYACLVRYQSVLAILPLAIYLLLISTQGHRPLRAFGGLAVGLALFLAFILSYNAWTYGGAFVTGYSPSNGLPPYAIFSWRYFIGDSPIGLSGLPALLRSLWSAIHIGLILAIIGLIIMPRAEAVLLGGSILVFFILATFYLYPADTRYVLFSIPMIFLAMAYLIVRVVNRLLTRYPQWVGVVVVGIIVIWQLPSFSESRQQLSGRNKLAAAMVERAEAFTRDTDPNAVFLSRKYHDLIILYGHRSALYFELLAPSDLASGQYQVEGYDRRLTDVVSRLLAQGTPVFIVQDPEGTNFGRGPIDPFPILKDNFGLEQVREYPPVYKVSPLEKS